MNTSAYPSPKELESFTKLAKTEELPSGFCVLSKNNNAFVATSQDGLMSMVYPSYKEALNWAISREFIHSDRYPNVGELWRYAEREVIICGNHIKDNNTIWILDWNSGDRDDAPLDMLEPHEDRMSLSESMIIERFTDWARHGNSDAIWWLGWWYEGKNHAKSVWFYIAALRANPSEHDWAFDRIRGDALRPGGMCEGVPMPDLAFLEEIPEIQGAPISQDWVGAVHQAELAEHIPAEEQITSRMQKYRFHAPTDK